MKLTKEEKEIKKKVVALSNELANNSITASQFKIQATLLMPDLREVKEIDNEQGMPQMIIWLNSKKFNYSRFMRSYYFQSEHCD